MNTHLPTSEPAAAGGAATITEQEQADILKTGRIHPLYKEVHRHLKEVARNTTMTKEERAAGIRLGRDSYAYHLAVAVCERVAVEAEEAAENAVPDAADYRVDEWDEDLCMGRILSETDTHKDRRWKPAIYRETQCDRAPDARGLCKKCQANYDRYLENPKPGSWRGRIDEEPLDWLHMLGTLWAESKQPKFVG